MVTNTISSQKTDNIFSGLGRMIGAELLKLRKRQMTSVLLFILVGIIVIVNLILLAISKANVLPSTGPRLERIQNLLGLPYAIPFAFALMATFGIVLAIILTASSVGNEYNWKTIRTALISARAVSNFSSRNLFH